MKRQKRDCMTQPHLCRINFESRTNTIFKRLLPQSSPCPQLVILILEIYMAACSRLERLSLTCLLVSTRILVVHVEVNRAKEILIESNRIEMFV